MQVIWGLENIGTPYDSVITIGTFDGIHSGHIQIIDRVCEVSGQKHMASSMVTFDPHPKRVVNPALKDQIKLLSTIEEKIEQLKKTDLDHLIIIRFDKAFSSLSYETFLKSVLIERIGARYIIVGYDHAFGKNREGNYSTLKELQSKYGFGVEQVQPVERNDHIVSSSLIRQMIKDGKVEEAVDYLGRQYTLYGKVKTGSAMGKALKFPTANIEPLHPNKIIPADGVYAVDVRWNDQVHKGMMNIGFKPTLHERNKKRSLEVHLFDFNEDIYNQTLKIIFKKRLRSEKKFSSKEELVEQLKIDMKNSLQV
ncbi:MAG: bifunctional riboflavin kinase/FAD synthetase [Caldithrix sp.]|nr:bifunctional riboflavin kinase/FAD synthetase [Caldithrix sp.]